MRGFLGLACLLMTALGACSAPRQVNVSRPNIAPSSQPSSAPSLASVGTQVEPLYREIMAIDLPTVVRIAAAQNIDIRLAAQRVIASRGRLESTQGAVFPVFAPAANFEHVDGTVRASQGNLIGVGFDCFQVYAALQAVLNPGRVIYDIIAARKRLAATEHEADAVVLETLRTAAARYYELLLARARLAAARQAVAEAEELVRITQLRERTGMGVRADELRAEAELASRQQDAALRLYDFYVDSVALSVTLHVDAAITLSPADETLSPVALVREDLSLDELLGLAVQYRPDLQSVRELVDAADAEHKAAWWAALGAQFRVDYQYGGITGHADRVVPGASVPNNLIINPFSNNGQFSTNPAINGFVKQQLLENSQKHARPLDRTYTFSDQNRLFAVAAWHLSISAIGDLKTAGAAQAAAGLDAERRLDEARAEVVRDLQAARTYWQIIPQAQRQVSSANEALRLTQANLRAGTMTTLDVLQAEDTVARALVRHAEAIVRYNQSQVNLAASVGLFDQAAIAPPLAQEARK